MEAPIIFVIANFTLSFAVLGLVCAGLAIALHRPPRTAAVVVEALAAWFYLFSIGVAYFYNFVMHVFFGEMAARFIGWADSPFQLEVGFASLGFAVLGFIAFRGAFPYRVAAVLGVGCFLWGAAGGHIYQMAVHDNYAPGNAGIIFYTDLLVPLAGLILLWLQHRLSRPSAPPRRAAA